jgi:hypothetical protein
MHERFWGVEQVYYSGEKFIMLKTGRVISSPVTVGSIENIGEEIIQKSKSGYGGYVVLLMCIW